MNGILVLCQGDTVLLWHPHKSIQSEHVKIDIIVISASNKRRPKFLKLISDIQHHVCVTLFFKYDVHRTQLHTSKNIVRCLPANETERRGGLGSPPRFLECNAHAQNGTVL